MLFCLDGMAWDGNITIFFLLLYMYTNINCYDDKDSNKTNSFIPHMCAHHNNHKHNVIILLFLTVLQYMHV